MTGMGDVLNPTDIAIQRDLAGGLTVANILHGSANPIGGKSVTIKLRWGAKKGEDLLFGALPGIKFALGENPKRPGANQPTPRRYPATRQGVEFVIRDAFTRAKVYQRAWQDYTKAKAANQDVMAPRRDLQLDALVEVLEGKRLVHCHSYRADEILMMIRLADEMGFKVATFQHVLEGYKVAKEMAAHGAGGSTFSDWWGYKIEAEDAIPGNASIMTAKGVISLDQLRQRRARAASQHRGRQVRPLGRHERRPGDGARDDEPGEATADRLARGLARSRQGRRRRHLVASPAQHLRHRREDVHRRHRVLRPRAGAGARRDGRQGEGDDGAGQRVRAVEAPARPRRRAICSTSTASRSTSA